MGKPRGRNEREHMSQLGDERVSNLWMPFLRPDCLRRYFPDRCYTLRCLNDLVSLSYVARQTTLPKSWSLCFHRRPLSNSSRYSKLSCSICGSETQPAAAKRCCACVLMKSFRALSTRAPLTGQRQESR